MTDREVNDSNEELDFRLMHVHRAFCAEAWCMCIQQPSAQDVPSQKINQPLCVLDLVSFFLGSFVTDLRCLNPYWAIWFTIFVVDCMRKDRLPSDVYVDLTCKFGGHGLVSPVRGRLIGGMLNFDSDALI